MSLLFSLFLSGVKDRNRYTQRRIVSMNSKIYVTILIIIFTISCSKNSKDYLSEAKVIIDSKTADKSELLNVVDNMKLVLKDDPNSIDAINYIMLAFTQLDDNEAALKFMDDLIDGSENPSDILFYNRGMLKTLLDDNKGAIEDFQKTILISPKNKNAYNNIISLKLEQNYFVNNQWSQFTKDDLQRIIDDTYPESINKPSIEEFINSDQICYINFGNLDSNK